MWGKKSQWIHFTGIGGITVGQLAVAYHLQGYTVTGSDTDIYEPMSSFLKKYPVIKINSGYSYKHLTFGHYSENEQDSEVLPELVIASGGLSEKNKEILFAQKRGIPVKNYAQVFESDLIMKDDSIVIAGSFGKTTVTALLVSIFREATQEISFMFGGMVDDIDVAVRLKNNQTKYSIVEGDEYISSRVDYISKFFHYHPRYLVLTGYAYDHADIFPTPKSYYENFSRLVALLPSDGLLIVNAKYEELNKLAENAPCRVIRYSLDANFPYKTRLIGAYNRENITAAVTLARALAIDPAAITRAVEKFSGVKRRLELKPGIIANPKIRIIDDFGSTPAKARASIETVREDFPEAQIIALFEPNIGMRNAKAVGSFKDVFTKADHVCILPFSAVKQAGVLSQEEFVEATYPLNSNVNMVALPATESEFLHQIKNIVDPTEETILLFLSSHAIDSYLSWLKHL